MMAKEPLAMTGIEMDEHPGKRLPEAN